ncbi:Hsp20/alpha crystallin family protein [Roseburia sp. 1XD42-34]|nr:Hsp20/alpha crystallin family protein [Roseburia sp. 1XD42-34]RKI76226.1 Hsp20/alpha crystallin family protein [Clostridium sp. 1xD42-85]
MRPPKTIGTAQHIVIINMQKEVHLMDHNRWKRGERGPFQGIMEQMDAFFNESAKNFNALIKRPLNVRTRETEANVIVEAELPGFKRDQIQLEIFGNQLRITAEDHSYTDNDTYNRKAEKTITLPFAISEKETKAKLDNGVLQVIVPKNNSSRKFIDIHDTTDS